MRTTVESLNELVKMKTSKGCGTPIYRVFVFEHPNKELVYKSGKASGMPDMGGSADMGFYYDLEDAVRTMHDNIADIQECLYRAGFVLCQFPGLYQLVSSEERIYFVWDEEKEGFFEADEPEIFGHMAF